jgi:hypothetical protein
MPNPAGLARIGKSKRTDYGEIDFRPQSGMRHLNFADDCVLFRAGGFRRYPGLSSLAFSLPLSLALHFLRFTLTQLARFRLPLPEIASSAVGGNLLVGGLPKCVIPTPLEIFGRSGPVVSQEGNDAAAQSIGNSGEGSSDPARGTRDVRFYARGCIREGQPNSLITSSEIG